MNMCRIIRLLLVQVCFLGLALGVLTGQTYAAAETASDELPFSSLAEIKWYVQEVAPANRSRSNVKLVDQEGLPMLCYDDPQDIWVNTIMIAWPNGDLDPAIENWQRYPAVSCNGRHNAEIDNSWFDLGIYHGRPAIAFQDYISVSLQSKVERSFLAFAWAFTAWPRGEDKWSMTVVDNFGICGVNWDRSIGSEVSLATNGKRPVIAYNANGLRHADALSDVPLSPELWAVFQPHAESTDYGFDIFPTVAAGYNTVMIGYLRPDGEIAQHIVPFGYGENWYEMPVDEVDVVPGYKESGGIHSIAMMLGSDPWYCVNSWNEHLYFLSIISTQNEDNSRSYEWQGHILCDGKTGMGCPAMTSLDGRPLIALKSITTLERNRELVLYWAKCSDPQDAEDWESVALDQSGWNSAPIDLALIDGLPYVAYLTSNRAVRLAIPTLPD